MKKDAYRLAAIAAFLIAGTAVAGGLYLRQQRAERGQMAERAAATQAKTGSSALVRAHSRSLGPASAKVTVVEFFDPECESCRAIHPMIKQLLAQYGDRVRLVLRYMPFHASSLQAASALEAAGEQGRYWEMLEVLFENQPIWGSHHQPKPELIPEYAQQIGLDMTRFQRAYGSSAHRVIVETDRADGQSLGVTGTPTFFVNGRPVVRLGYEGLKALIEEELAK